MMGQARSSRGVRVMFVCVNLKRRDRGRESGGNFKFLEKCAVNAQVN